MATSPAAATRMGRPRGFSEDEAVEAAMRVFWKQGYEGATISDLTAAMGINRSSLYTIFGDKEALFRRALERYREGPASYVWQAVLEPTARRVVETLLRGALDLLTNTCNPQGCLSVQGALAVGNEAASAKQAMIAFRKTGEVALTERFTMAQKCGEIGSTHDPGDLARYVLTLLTGLGIHGVNGATRSQMEAIVSIALQSLPF